MQPPEVKENWKRAIDKHTNTPVWPPKGTTVTIILKDYYEQTSLDGKWGARTVYTLNTQELGKIYLSEANFKRVLMKIGDLPEGTDTFTVEL